ncbi:hypothetical protein CUZ88_1322 [Enterococcus xinjiangensis]|nr:hypothetical protein [Enterococcus lactis]
MFRFYKYFLPSSFFLDCILINREASQSRYLEDQLFFLFWYSIFPSIKETFRQYSS